jgi:type IV pilus assembly protein PilA
MFTIGGRGADLVVLGDGPKLGALAALIEAQLRSIAKLADENAKAALDAANVDDGFDPEQLAMVLGRHLSRQSQKLLAPKLDGGRLSLALPLAFGDDGGGAIVAVAVVGVLSAVAIPAFMKYLRKSKSSEAMVGVKRLFDGARTYYLDNQKLPPSVGPTPPPGSCCRAPGGKCAPDPKLWDVPGWRELAFSMDDPFEYSYEFVAGATDFTVRVVGDLDCDGEYSTFQIVGKLLPDGTVSGKAGVFVDRELE